MKILLIIIDGLGDRPIPQLGNKTPLEAAKTPNFDYLAKEGICGLMKPVFTGAIPTSEEGHFSLFGYDPKIYKIRRGFFTAKGAGIKIKKGDIALRGNFATVDDKLNIIDRRAGRIKDPQPLIDLLNGMRLDGVKFILKSAKEHRIGIVLRGENLSSEISDSDPFYEKLRRKVQTVRPLNRSKEAEITAKILNKFLEKAHEILKNHPFNKKREKKGKPPANYIITRGASSLLSLPTFKEKYGLRACCIAGKLLYKQIGEFLGMQQIKVRGTNGLPSTNLRGKFLAAKKAILKYNFIFLHIKATDSLAEDGDFLGKKKFIEKVDENLKAILSLKNTFIVVTADHSTCSLLKRHCKRPVPILIYGAGRDSVKRFSERECKKGKLGIFKQTMLMPKILSLAPLETNLGK